MLRLDVLRTELPATLASFGASVEVRFGCPNPASSAWKLVAEFSHPVGVGIVTVWEHMGCCDIDFLVENAPDGVFFHGEFISDSTLIEFVVSTLSFLFIPPAIAINRAD